MVLISEVELIVQEGSEPWGGSLSLVVTGGDSRSEGHGFESLHRILDGHFSHIFVVKIVMCV